MVSMNPQLPSPQRMSTLCPRNNLVSREALVKSIQATTAISNRCTTRISKPNSRVANMAECHRCHNINVVLSKYHSYSCDIRATAELCQNGATSTLTIPWKTSLLVWSQSDTIMILFVLLQSSVDNLRLLQVLRCAGYWDSSNRRTKILLEGGVNGAILVDGR